VKFSRLFHRAAKLIRPPERRLPVFIIAIWALTLADVALTHHGLQIGAICEGNPILAALFDISPALAAASVLLYVGLACVALWWARNKVVWLPAAVRVIVVVKVVVLGAHALWAFRIV